MTNPRLRLGARGIVIREDGNSIKAIKMSINYPVEAQMNENIMKIAK